MVLQRCRDLCESSLVIAFEVAWLELDEGITADGGSSFLPGGFIVCADNADRDQPGRVRDSRKHRKLCAFDLICKHVNHAASVEQLPLKEICKVAPRSKPDRD